MMDTIIGFLWQLVALPTAFLIGWATERRHIRSLEERERNSTDVRVSNLKEIYCPKSVQSSDLVMGHVVIATDYWKSTATKLRSLVGGEMKYAQMLMIRARREALLRLIEQARRRGASEVCNVRFEFSNIGMMRGNQGAIQVELLAYGTALIRIPDD